MGKNRTEPNEKVMTVRNILDGKESQRHAAGRLGVSVSSIQQWISIFRIDGEDAFKQNGNRKYLSELKD